MKSFWIFFLERKAFTYLVMIALVFAGFYSVLVIPKESAPEVIIPVGVVTTVLRGGSGEDVEKLVTNKLEQEIINVENIDKVTSSSRDGVSVISAQFIASADVEKSIQDLKDAVDRVKGQLPSDAEEPNVLKVNFADQPILIMSVSQDLSPVQLTELGEDLKNELKKVKGVSKVELSGVREKQVQVIIEKDKLARYGLPLDRVIGALTASNANFPIGKIVVDNIEYPIKFSGEIKAGSEVENIAIQADNGTVVYVRDIAVVSDGLENARTYSRVSVDGEPSENALALYVYKKSGGDVTEIGNAVKQKVEELKKEGGMLSGGNVVISIDAGKEVNKDLTNLSRTAIETIILVMLVLFLTIGWRESVVAGISIPLSFVIAFIGLYLSGNTINFLSLFSLILAIGILVDSGIVVAESIHTRMQSGATVEDAAKGTIDEYAWPLIAGTMTTVAVFAPLFFLSGIVGQFVSSIPFTIIFVLIASIFVALGMVPILATLLIKKEKADQKPNRLTEYQEKYFHITQEWYKNFLRGVLTEKKQQRIFFWSMVVLFVLAFGLVFAGMIKTELFPQDDQSYVVVSIEKSEGSSLESTDLVVRQVEEILYEQKYVESFVTTVGASSALTDNSGGSGNSKFANITVILPEKRDLTSSEIVNLLRDDFANIRDGIVKVGQANNGPPSGKPVAIKFLGDDLEQISAAADKAENILLSIEGTEGVETSLKDDSNQFELVVDKQKAAAAGLSPIQIASTLRTAVSGSIATTIKKQDDDIDILVRVDLNDKFINPEDANRANLDNLQNIEIMTPRGGVILGSILEAKLSSNKSVISHEDQKRVVTVSSDLKDGKTATEIVNAFQKREAELKVSPDVQIKYGGETEDVDNTFRDMLIALIAGMVLMLAILVLEFNSFRYSFYLLSAVPLSLIGVFFGLFITGKALSFSAMLGIVALAGVVINHAIILLDSIIHRLDREIERVRNDDTQDQNILLNAIVDSSAIRLRPIVLTTLTTVVGMIPLANVSALWGPLAITIMFGLLFSMVLTLIFIPLRFYKKPGKRYGHLKIEIRTQKGSRIEDIKNFFKTLYKYLFFWI